MRLRRFRSRLLAMIVGLLVVSQGVVLVVVARSMRQSAVDEIHGNLIVAVHNLERLIADRMAEHGDKARLLAGDYALRQTLLATDDAATLGSALETYRERLGGSADRVRASRIVLLGPEGDMIVETGAPLGEPEREVFAELARQASASEEFQPTARGIAIVDGGLHGVLVVPVFAPPPEIVAWMGVAFPIDGAFAEQIKSMSRIELVITHDASGPGLLASTLPGPRASGLLDAPMLNRAGDPEALEADTVLEARLGGERFVALLRRLPLVAGEPVLAVFLRSLDAELAPVRRVELVLLLTAIAGLGAGCLVAVRLARSVSRPVHALTAHTRVIAGGDYASRLSIAGVEEFEELAGAFNAMSAGLAERDRVRDLLDKNVSPEVAEQLMRDGAALGGEEREVTILFADLRGFTPLSERLSPRELVSLLNRYLDRMSAAIEAEGGVIDKFIGDAIMAVFGAPVKMGDAADRALRAALGMRGALASLNTELAAEGQPPLEFGVGINTARVVAGNIGSHRRLNYSVIGDGVNVAARLQTLTRSVEYATDVLVSGATVRSATAGFSFRRLGTVSVKGRVEAVEICALDGLVSV